MGLGNSKGERGDRGERGPQGEEGPPGANGMSDCSGIKCKDDVECKTDLKTHNGQCCICTDNLSGGICTSDIPICHIKVTPASGEVAEKTEKKDIKNYCKAKADKLPADELYMGSCASQPDASKTEANSDKAMRLCNLGQATLTDSQREYCKLIDAKSADKRTQEEKDLALMCGLADKVARDAMANKMLKNCVVPKRCFQPNASDSVRKETDCTTAYTAAIAAFKVE